MSEDHAQRAVVALTEAGLRLLIDSEALDQAVYLFRPVFTDGVIVDLEIVMVNEAARHVELSSHIVEGVLASEVFVDPEVALVAANAAWRGQRPAGYNVERRGFHDGEPMVVRYEVATMRVDDYIVQVSIDHTTVSRLASADTRFRLMAEGSTDALVLLSPDLSGGHYVVVYANPTALAGGSNLRVGDRLPADLDEIVADAARDLRDRSSVRRLIERTQLARRVTADITFTAVGDGQVMVAARELTSEDTARVELERSDRVLRAIGAGAFGTIAVYEPSFDGEELAALHLLWSASGHGHGAGSRTPLDPTSVISASDVLRMAQAMLAAAERTRSGWVPVHSDGDERSVEFTLVHAGDRFVLEFVERTEELAGRTALAMIAATSEAQRSFLSRVSHELRSPLNVINGYSQLLGRMRLPEPAGDHVAHIDRGVERMVHIVDDLLLLGQLDQGLLRIDDEPVDVGHLVAEVVAAGGRLPWWRHELVQSPVDRQHGPSVRSDPGRLVGVVLLLMEASLAVGAVTPIEVASFARGAHAGLQLVTDAASPVVETVWRPFVGSHTIPGSGLGLAVARGMARALDLTMEVREVPGAQPRAALLFLRHVVT